MAEIELLDILQDGVDVVDQAVDRWVGTLKGLSKEMLQDELKKQDLSIKHKKRVEAELRKQQLEENIRNAQLELEAATTFKAKAEKEQRLLDLQHEKQLEERKAAAQEKINQEQAAVAQKAADKAVETIRSGINALHSGMTTAATTYSSFMDRIQTRLLGANETYSSVTSKVTKAFGASPFFQMQKVMDKVAEAVEKGISFNVEARAAMEVLSEKVAQTFNAFDSSLLRLVKIQQADSTQARLGMESVLNEFLNQQYQDTSYLSDLSTVVRANLLEASSLRSREEATQFELTAQKWLGSMSSVGVSNDLIQQLSAGLGYLGSGDISSLASNQKLEQLLVAAANRSGVSYGDILTQGAQSTDIDALMRGLRSLVTEIYSSGNVVAMNQYAQIFGMAVSDIRSLMNLTEQHMETISTSLVKSYSELTQRVVDETTFSKLYGRTGGATIGENLYQNFLSNVGQQIGESAGGYLAWQVAGLMSDLMAGVTTGIAVTPFGVGTTLNLSVGELMKTATVAGGALAGIVSMMQGLGSIRGVDLSALEEEQSRITSRGLLSTLQEGTMISSTSYAGDYSEGALASSANAAAAAAAVQYSDEDFDEEKRQVEKTQQAMTEIGDNIKFIVQLLNESGIVIRGRVGAVQTAKFFDELAGQTLDFTVGG